MGKKIKKYKVGLNSETYKISMVTEPAIEVDYVALEKQKEEVEVKLSSDERHICYGPALIPNKDIYRNNGKQEFYINFSEDSIVKMSQEFMKDFRQHDVNLQHEDDVDNVFVCESWIVEDPYKDKSNALGFNVEKGTWMVGMKVNNDEVWEKVKSGELKGFSVESALRLEDFEKQNNNNMDIETNEMFWDKMKNILKEAFGKAERQEDIEPIDIEDLEAQAPTETETTTTTTVEEPKAEEPKVEEPKEEPKVEEPKVEEPKPAEEPKEEPKVDNNAHLEELIKSLKEEINALKEMNNGLDKKVKELSKEPSTKPLNTNAKPSTGDTYSAWREQMAKYL